MATDRIGLECILMSNGIFLRLICYLLAAKIANYTIVTAHLSRWDTSARTHTFMLELFTVACLISAVVLRLVAARGASVLWLGSFGKLFGRGAPVLSRPMSRADKKHVEIVCLKVACLENVIQLMK